ncbi:hypothetical protein LIER_33018 [Lithospermum erythrorhizon]|uniref:Uncharacterized protein n=1 Tax=Lithospermum erythrorhizon TaxID=34254 RepID=A0AAV3RYN1_LITER
MHTTKKEALRDTGSDDVMDLVDKAKPSWMHTQATWDSFIQHFTDPKTMQVSQSAKKSRSAEGAGRHGLGNLSLKNRMRKLGLGEVCTVLQGQVRARDGPFEVCIGYAVWNVLEEVEEGRKKGRRLGFSTQAQSSIFNPFPQSSFDSNDATTLDLVTQTVLAKEGEDRRIEQEALESKIAALEKSQVDANNEFWQMFANLREELMQSRISGSNN